LVGFEAGSSAAVFPHLGPCRKARPSSALPPAVLPRRDPRHRHPRDDGGRSSHPGEVPIPINIDAPCTQRLRHGDPIHASKGLTRSCCARRRRSSAAAASARRRASASACRACASSRARSCQHAHARPSTRRRRQRRAVLRRSRACRSATAWRRAAAAASSACAAHGLSRCARSWPATAPQYHAPSIACHRAPGRPRPTHAGGPVRAFPSSTS
jgi:hypothetical protein